jgi:hypothetical protein
MSESPSSSDRTPRAPRSGSFEDQQRALDPHRDEELQGVEAEVAGRLRSRGVYLTGQETPDDMADLLDAVERFEGAVEAHGGDLFVDTPASLASGARVSQPDNPAYVLPERAPQESVARYLVRVSEATERLLREAR